MRLRENSPGGVCSLQGWSLQPTGVHSVIANDMPKTEMKDVILIGKESLEYRAQRWASSEGRKCVHTALPR